MENKIKPINPLHEILIASLVALCIVSKIWVEYKSDVIVGEKNSSIFIASHYYDFLLVFILPIAPILFRMIFGYSLINFIAKELQLVKKKVPEDLDYKDEEKRKSKEERASYEMELIQPAFSRQIIESRELAQKVYNRSSFYLLIGVSFALGGLIFIYSPSLLKSLTTTNQSETFDSTRYLLELMPRLGCLIFIELIAFFFLKQYRITMDEFRYYDSKKREVESNFLIFRIYLSKSFPDETTKSLLGSMSLFSNPALLKKGETTELLESRKYTDKELGILEKIVETFKIKP